MHSREYYETVFLQEKNSMKTKEALMIDNDNTKSDILAIYLKDVNKYPLLTRKEEKELINELLKAKKSPDNSNKYIEIRNRIVLHNLRLASKFAKIFSHQGAGLLDHIQEGIIGLIRAVDKLKPFNNSYATYGIYWVIGLIKNSIKDYGDQIGRLSNDFFKGLKKIQQAIMELNETDREISANNIAEITGMKIKTVVGLINANCRQALSLNQESSNDGSDRRLADVIEDKRYYSLEEILIAKSEQEEIITEIASILKLIKDLPAREQNIFYQRHRLNQERRKARLAELGEIYQISRERIRQIQVKIWKFIYLKTFKNYDKEELKALIKEEMEWFASCLEKLDFLGEITGIDAIQVLFASNGYPKLKSI